MKLSNLKQSGHAPSLLSAFLHFDISFMVWVILGALAPFISKDLALTASQKGLLLAVPLLGSAFFRLLFGFFSDRFGSKCVGVCSLGGFVGLSSFLNGFFVDQYGVAKAAVGIATAPLIIAGSLLRPVGGGLADRLGGIRMLTLLYSVVIVAMVGVGFAIQNQRLVFVLLFVGMGCLGMGNGSVFQLVPQRFRAEIGAMTGLVGAVGGVGGFYLNLLLGNLKDATGSYASGFWAFAITASVALVALRMAAPGWVRSWLGAGGVVPAGGTQAVVNSASNGRNNTIPELID